MIILSKVLPFFLMPLEVTTALVLAGILLRGSLLCLAGILVLWAAAMSVTSNSFVRMIEGHAVRMAAEEMPSQGRAMQQHALDMGVRPESLRVTDQVVNTAAEAEAVAQMLPASAWVLLVTSACHMARAKKEFEQAGLGERSWGQACLFDVVGG